MLAEYKNKLRTFEEAASLVKSGDLVLTGQALGGCSPEFYDALLARHEELRDVVLMDILQLRPSKVYDPEYMAQFDGHINYWNSFGVGMVRKINSSKVPDCYPAQTSDCIDKFSERADVFICMVSPPNSKGYVNMGPCNFFSSEVIKKGRASGKQRLTIAEVNDQVPIIYGDNWLHISNFDCFIEHSSPMPIVKRGEPTETDKIIGNYVLELINDRDNIQMGIGGISEAVVSGLEGKHDLGVITEMFPAGLPQLVEKGIITNKYKPFHQGVTIATFCMGDQEMYDFISENPSCEIYPSSYTNNPFFIAQHPNMVAINSALMVDLSGQIASEGIGHNQISGTGGQLDFMIGSFFSPGGKGITLINSARMKNGILSSAIVPELPPGTPVTVPRVYAQYVVTEYGIADLKNKSRRERANALIEIAHPDIRGELRAAMRKNFYPQSPLKAVPDEKGKRKAL